MNKKLLAMLCILGLAATSVLGCSPKDAGSSGSAASGNETGKEAQADELSEKLTLTWMVRAFQGGGWPDDHPMIQELNRKFNVDLKIQWVPAANYKEKLNVLAASNDFPDMFFVLYQEFNKWKKQGLFLDVQPVLSQYPNLEKIPQDSLKTLNPQGKLLGFPYYVTQSRDSLALREDWLKKLNLPEPKTLDEFYEVAKAFATKDPDGNGNQDTAGFSFYIETATQKIRDIEFVLGAFGLGNEWKEIDGKLAPYQTQVEEWKQALAFLSKAYAEGVLDKDFAVNKVRGPLEKFESGKIGFALVNPNQLEETRKNLRGVVPDGTFKAIEPPKGPTGLSGTQNLDMLDKYVINAKIDPKKQRRILMMMDYFLSPEGSDFIKHGIEGVHYKKIADSKYEKLPAADKDRQNLINNWIFRPFDPGIQMYKWEDPAQHKIIRDMFEMNAKHQWSNPAAGLESDALTRNGPNLNAKFMEAVTKVIMGREPVDYIEKASAEWLANGGNKMIEEINKSYRE